jgi:SAM-dependent methyltransferase
VTQESTINALRASSFGSGAAAYAEHRPGYPGTAIAWALEPIAGRAHPRILDLGAGTGKLTASLPPYAESVVAVEPNAAMRAELAARLPDVEALAGSAEAIPLPAASVDAITVGQAMHWFDLEAAVPEMARVLRRGGVLCGLWNTMDEDHTWVRDMMRVSQSSVSYERWRPAAVPEPAPPFPVIERQEFAHTQRRTADTMAETLATHSHLLVLGEAERAEIMTRLADFLATRPETRAGEFELPMVTVAIRARRD